MSAGVCRACMCPLNSNSDVVHIFENMYRNVYNLPLMIPDIFKVKIEIDDEITKDICRHCADKIVELHQFYLMYLESDRKLRELLTSQVQENGDNKDIYLEDIYVESPNYGVSLKWACETCPERFVSKFALGKHKRICRVPASCKTECDDQGYTETGARSTNLANSSLSDSEESVFHSWECYKCHTEFKVSEDLERHSKICKVAILYNKRRRNPDASGNWNCKQCETEFPSKRKLNDHKNTVHPELNHYKRNYKINEKNEYTCNLCTEVFPTRRSVYEHIRKHSGQKALCNICGKFLSDRNNLNKHHQSVHLKQKKHKCTLCDKRYDSSYRLNIHLNSHKGIRNYSCQLCPSKFISCAALTRHLKTIHTEEKKYVCSICSKGFKLANKLKTHMFVHTGIYEHPCEHCGRGFRQRSKLIHHIQEIHLSSTV